MNKTELVAAMAEKTELSKKDAEKALKAFTDVVAEELKITYEELLKQLNDIQKTIIEYGIVKKCKNGTIIKMERY